MPFILATAGHVDHGKSSLVKALTGTDPDRLPEEKARGISIDLGFAHLELEAPAGVEGMESTRISCGIVDVPGHEDFVKNMVSGVGAVDVALLVVAADDGWMPQTEEHLQILLYLGVTRAVVALTKVDLAVDEASSIAAVRERLQGSPLSGAPIVPTSIRDGRGVDALRKTLAEVLGRCPPPADFGKPRLWVDRVFALRGIGTVVTGTLSGGSLARGDAVLVEPGRRTARIRACHTFGREVDRVQPGTRVALNLPELQVGIPGTSSSGSVGRGDVVTREAWAGASSTLDVWLERSSRKSGRETAGARPLKSGTRVAFHVGSTCVGATVQLMEGVALAGGQSACARLRLEQPVAVFVGDRFLIRDASQQATMAGGRVLLAEPAKGRLRDASRVSRLKACAVAESDVDPVPFLRAELADIEPRSRAGLLVRSRFSAAAVSGAMESLVVAGEWVMADGFVTSAAGWKGRTEEALRRVDAFHAAHPERPGLMVSDLRSALGWRGGAEGDGFSEFVKGLVAHGCEVGDGWVRRVGHRASLPVELQREEARIRGVLDRRPFDPPGKAELAPDDAGRRALALLLQNGELVAVGSDLVMSRTAYAYARERIVGHLRRNGSATAGELREKLGSTRRVMIPLLEHLDRLGLTAREGDVRKLGPKARSK